VSFQISISHRTLGKGLPFEQGRQRPFQHRLRGHRVRIEFRRLPGTRAPSPIELDNDVCAHSRIADLEPQVDQYRRQIASLISSAIAKSGVRSQHRTAHASPGSPAQRRSGHFSLASRRDRTNPAPSIEKAVLELASVAKR
jgi:hypothetical protein